MTERGRKSRRTSPGLKYLLVLLMAALVIVSALLFAEPTRADRNVDGTLPINETIVEELRSMEDEDVRQVVQKMTSVAESRWESESASIWESESVEQSIAMSIALEESSIEASEAQSLYESSVAEASKEAEYAALNAPLAGSHLIARDVVRNCDDTDIAYIRALYSHCIVIGNSRAKNAVDCGILTDNEVKYMSGVPIKTLEPFALQQAYLYAPKTLFIMGLNDVAVYDRDAEAFKADYTAMLRQYQAINPGKIYVMESLPLPDPAAEGYFYRAYTSLPAFNDAIYRMCQENGWTYVSASDYAEARLINSEDHAHYGKEFYFLWAQTIATQMHLWEDNAGLGYEIP